MTQSEPYKVFPDERPPPPAIASSAADDAAGKIRTPKVTLSRLKVEDEVLMQRSLTEFAKKSPELAKKLGVVKDEADMFSRMKADGECRPIDDCLACNFTVTQCSHFNLTEKSIKRKNNDHDDIKCKFKYLPMLFIAIADLIAIICIDLHCSFCAKTEAYRFEPFSRIEAVEGRVPEVANLPAIHEKHGARIEATRGNRATIQHRGHRLLFGLYIIENAVPVVERRGEIEGARRR